MPVIVIEGPDESGKTTLAKYFVDLLQTLLPDTEVTYARSPVKEHGWNHNLNHHLDRLAEVSNRDLLILDRTPEISEPIYGFLRDDRSEGWLSEVSQWGRHNILLVFCQGPLHLEEPHVDAEGWIIEDSGHRIICNLYEFTYLQLERYISSTGLINFQVAKWDRFKTETQQQTWFQIAWWLAHNFPHQRRQIMETRITVEENE